MKHTQIYRNTPHLLSSAVSDFITLYCKTVDTVLSFQNLGAVGVIFHVDNPLGVSSQLDESDFEKGNEINIPVVLINTDLVDGLT